MKRLLSLALLLTGLSTTALASCPPGLNSSDAGPPTDLSYTFIRAGAGEFGAAREKAPHSGADILPRGTYQDNAPYSVFSVADGTVIYAHFNGLTFDKGFGNVVIIDHKNDCYSMYAHLATDPFTPSDGGSGNFLVEPGQDVAKGQLVGYFVDQDRGLDSTGNAQRTDAGARWQTHFELIDAPSGAAGSSIGDVRQGRPPFDPTSFLLSLGYTIE